MGASPCASAQGVGANPDYGNLRGPIPIRDARPYNLLFLQFTPETGGILKAGTSRYDLQLDLTNNLLIPDPNLGATVVEQNEYQRLRFAWKHGVGKRTEIGVSVPLLWRNGGILDGIITFYHHLLGFADNAQDVPLGRDHYPPYQSHLEIIDANGHTLVNQGNAFGLGETVLSVSHSLIGPSRRSALATRFGLKLPTGNPTLILGSGSCDAGISLDARYSVGRDVALYGNLGYVVMGPAIKVPGARPNTVESLIALEYRANSRDSYVLQIDGNGQFVRTGNRFADGSNVTATFGVERVLDRRLVSFVSFSEAGHIHNFTLPALSNIGPGFTVSTGLTWLP
jgi:hypothetical protein